MQNTLADKLRENQGLCIELEAVKKKNGYDLEMGEKRVGEIRREIEMVNNLKNAKEEECEKRIKVMEQQIVRKDVEIKDSQGKIAELQDLMNKSADSSQTTISSLNNQIK